MKIDGISVRCHSVEKFVYKHGDKKRRRISFPKTQYAHRFICFTGGELDATVEGESYHISAGTVIYLVPGEEYRLLPTESDFSLVNIFFELVPTADMPKDLLRSCVFLDCFRRELCPPKVRFEDAPILDQSRVFEDSECGRIAAELFSRRSSGEHFSLYARAKILEMLYRLINSEKRSDASVNAKRIIAYINDNPTGELSAKVIAEKFGYHKNHINRLLKEAFGKTLSECVRRAKIGYARILLSETRIPPSEIAAELGYYDYSHFYKAFVAEVGCTPGEYLSSGI